MHRNIRLHKPLTEMFLSELRCLKRLLPVAGNDIEDNRKLKPKAIKPNP